MGIWDSLLRVLQAALELIDPEFLMLVHLDSLLAHGACSLAVHSSLEFMHHASVFSSYVFLLMEVAHPGPLILRCLNALFQKWTLGCAT